MLARSNDNQVLHSWTYGLRWNLLGAHFTTNSPPTESLRFCETLFRRRTFQPNKKWFLHSWLSTRKVFTLKTTASQKRRKPIWGKLVPCSRNEWSLHHIITLPWPLTFLKDDHGLRKKCFNHSCCWMFCKKYTGLYSVVRGWAWTWTQIRGWRTQYVCFKMSLFSHTSPTWHQMTSLLSFPYKLNLTSPNSDHRPLSGKVANFHVWKIWRGKAGKHGFTRSFIAESLRDSKIEAWNLTEFRKSK